MLAPEGMNSIAFGGDKGKRGEVYCLFGRYLCHGILFTRSHIIQLRWPILFIVCVLAPEGMNSIVFGGEKEEKSEDYCLLGRYSVQKRKMIYCNNIMINDHVQ